MPAIPGLELRVVLRSKIGTTIAWCTDSLTPEQRSTRQFFYRLSPNDQWVTAKVVSTPENPLIFKVREAGHSDDVMLPHVVTGPLRDDTTYEILAMFGREPNIVQASVKVVPNNQVGGFTRPRRFMSGGQPIQAEPVYIAGISPEAAKELAQAIRENGLEVTSPDAPPEKGG